MSECKNTVATETMVDKSFQLEAETVLNFLAELERWERKEFLVFIQGARFVRGLENTADCA